MKGIVALLFLASLFLVPSAQALSVNITVATGSDTHVSQQYPDTNYVGGQNVNNGYDSGQSKYFRGIYELNISSITGQQATIIFHNSTFFLHPELASASYNGSDYFFNHQLYNTPADFDVYRIIPAYDASTVTWNNQPCGTTINTTLCPLESTKNITQPATTYSAGGPAHAEYYPLNWILFNSTTSLQNAISNRDEMLVLMVTSHTSNGLFNAYSNQKTGGSAYSVSTGDVRGRVEINYDLVYYPDVTVYNPISEYKIAIGDTLVSVPISFIVNSSSLDSCWYSIDGGNNISLPSCNNATFSSGEGEFQIEVYANDTYGAIGYGTSSFNVTQLSSLNNLPPNMALLSAVVIGAVISLMFVGLFLSERFKDPKAMLGAFIGAIIIVIMLATAFF